MSEAAFLDALQRTIDGYRAAIRPVETVVVILPGWARETEAAQNPPPNVEIRFVDVES